MVKHTNIFFYSVTVFRLYLFVYNSASPEGWSRQHIELISLFAFAYIASALYILSRYKMIARLGHGSAAAQKIRKVK